MSTFPELALCEQPQARIETYGTSALSDTELLAMVLQGASMAPSMAVNTACRIMAEAGSLASLAAWQAGQFEAFEGVGETKAAQLMAAIELSRRLVSSHHSTSREPINRAALVAELLTPLTIGLEVEKFWVLCLDRKNRLIKRVELTSGSATCTLAHPRDVFKAAIRHNATAITCAHNHPSGDPTPSSQDQNVTRLLRESARTVEIELLDHVIVGRAASDPMGRGFFSFREAGLL